MNIPIMKLFNEYDEIVEEFGILILYSNACSYLIFKEKARELEVEMKTKIVNEDGCCIDFKNQYRLVFYPQISTS